MRDIKKTTPISILAEKIEIPDDAYERAESRYQDIGDWLCRPESTCAQHSPSIFAQGSFLLGTVTRPPSSSGEYDLDLAVKLQEGISKTTHTQRELKKLIGDELESYRKARQIQKKLDEKTRCWRLYYKDRLSFHIDVVPCIPEEIHRRGMIKDALLRYSVDSLLAEKVANLTVSVTDNKRTDYQSICLNWNISNPQGYGHWFSSRIQLAEKTIRDRLLLEKRASVEELPTYKLKAPLQYSVQLLKLHRDTMFAGNPDSKPISIVLTTLAAQAYNGQDDITDSILHIVNNMEKHIRDEYPYIPNPVNPEEDFSEKWYTDEGRRLNLANSFAEWLKQAKADFHHLASIRDPNHLIEYADRSLGLTLDKSKLVGRLGSAAAPIIAVTPTHRIKQAPKPWSP